MSLRLSFFISCRRLAEFSVKYKQTPQHDDSCRLLVKTLLEFVRNFSSCGEILCTCTYIIVFFSIYELLPGVKEGGGEESVKLVRPFRMQEWYHPANIMQTFHLRAQRRFFMKITMDKIAILLRGDPTHSVNPDAARMSYYFAHHMFRRFIFVTTNREVGVAPLTSVFAIKQFSRFIVDCPLSSD